MLLRDFGVVLAERILRDARMVRIHESAMWDIEHVRQAGEAVQAAAAGCPSASGTSALCKLLWRLAARSPRSADVVGTSWLDASTCN